MIYAILDTEFSLAYPLMSSVSLTCINNTEVDPVLHEPRLEGNVPAVLALSKDRVSYYAIIYKFQ